MFRENTSAIAVEPVATVRTVTEPMLGLSTNPDEHFERRGGTGQKTVEVRYPDSRKNRQLHSYELLVDPAYQIDVAVKDETFYRALAARLDAGTTHYPVSMGLSEYLAWIEFHGEFDVESLREGEARTGDTAGIDSALPTGTGPVVPQSGVRTRVERMPAFMEADDRGRRTTDFGEYTFTGNERLEVRTDEVAPVTVDGRTVVFG